ncbi:MAG TPA: hypothetical protein PLC79_04155 [Phycisphaerae bacterium]|nr:hypothetical protein [Phycisphaerae bacterium]
MHQLPLFSEEPIVVTRAAVLYPPSAPAPSPKPSAPPATATLEQPAPPSAGQRLAEIVQALHAKTAKGFRAALDGILLPEERLALEAAEALDLRLQQAHILDRIVHRLTCDFAKTVGWPGWAIADVLEPARLITGNLRAITLRLNSRGLCGAVCFRVSQPGDVSAPIPPAALAAASETRHYWRAIRYLEPLFAGGRLLRSQQEARERYARAKDPLIVGFLGAGPQPDYGLHIPQLFTRRGRLERMRCADTPFRLFVIAHYD